VNILLYYTTVARIHIIHHIHTYIHILILHFTSSFLLLFVAGWLLSTLCVLYSTEVLQFICASTTQSCRGTVFWKTTLLAPFSKFKSYTAWMCIYLTTTISTHQPLSTRQPHSTASHLQYTPVTCSVHASHSLVHTSHLSVHASHSSGLCVLLPPPPLLPLLRGMRWGVSSRSIE
jgi:hypothetical protein